MADDVDLGRELKRAQLDAALLDVELKRKELISRPTIWKGALANPIVLGALITAFITLNTAIVSSFTSANQLHLDERKFQTQTNFEREKFLQQTAFEAQKFKDQTDFEKEKNRQQYDFEQSKFALQSRLDRERLQSDLMTKLIQTNDPKQSAINVLFFVEAGLLPDPDGRIRQFVERQQRFLPPQLGTPVAPN